MQYAQSCRRELSRREKLRGGDRPLSGRRTAVAGYRLSTRCSISARTGRGLRDASGTRLHLFGKNRIGRPGPDQITSLAGKIIGVSQCVGKVIGIREGVKEADFFLDNGPGGRKRRLDI